MMRSPEAAFDLRSVLAKEVRRAIKAFEKAPASPKAIHSCRIALKRARALAKVGGVGAPGLAEVFNDNARAVMHTLGRARDDWALEKSARKLSKDVGKKSRRELRDLAHRVHTARQAASALNIEGVRASLKDLLAIAQVWPDASPRQVERGARRLARKARKLWRRDRDNADGHHQWRKREKDRLYAATLLGAAWPNGRPRRRKANAALAEMLGDERDVLLVMERLARDRVASRVPDALHDLARARKRIAKRAHTLARKLHAGGA
jgi:hypothetical protein